MAKKSAAEQKYEAGVTIASGIAALKLKFEPTPGELRTALDKIQDAMNVLQPGFHHVVAEMLRAANEARTRARFEEKNRKAVGA